MLIFKFKTYPKRVNFFLLIFVLLVNFSCIDRKNREIPPETKSKAKLIKDSETIIDINTGDCRELLGYREKYGAGISAFDLSTMNNMLIGIYFDDLNELYAGLKIYASGSKTNNPYFSATITNTSNTSSLISWGMDLDDPIGILTIKSIDISTGLVSFDITFKAGRMNSAGEIVGAKSLYTGSFENVVVFEDQEAAINCETSMPGFGNGNSNGSGNGNTPGGNNGEMSSITFNNSTFRPIDITFNGETKRAPVSGSATFSGKAGAVASGTASSSGATNSGTQVGVKLTWTFSNVIFPATSGGSSIQNLSVNKDYFFLKVQNKSGKAITKLYVNYGLQNQTVDDIVMVSDNNKTYDLGYYRAFNNSNVRAETTNGSYWYWKSLALPFTDNQSMTIIANP